MKSVIITVFLLLFAFYTTFGANTTIAQTVVGPDNQNASGTARIRITAPCTNGSSFVGQRDIMNSFTNGVFSQALVPTDACVIKGSATGSAWVSSNTYAVADRVTYAGAVFAAVASSMNVTPGSDKTIWQQISPTYGVHFKLITGVEWDENWAVFTSGSPVTIASVRISQPPLPVFVVAGPPGPGGSGGSGGGGIDPNANWAAIEAGTSGSGPALPTSSWAQIEAM